MAKNILLLAASLIAPFGATAQNFLDNVPLELPVVQLDAEGIDTPGEYFEDIAPWEYLPEQCMTVSFPDAACNLGDESFLEFISEFSSNEDFRHERILLTNYSKGETVDDKCRYFDYTIPYYEENSIIPIKGMTPHFVNGVENFATFYAVSEDMVGYQTVISLEDNYLMAALGFVRYFGKWYCTSSTVIFIDYAD